MYYTRSFVAKKAIIAHPIKKVKSSFFANLAIYATTTECAKKEGPPRVTRDIPGSQPHSDSRDDRRQRSGLFKAGMASSFRENASGLMLVSPS